MTPRKDLLERLEAVNPVPDPSRIYEAVEMADRLSMANATREQTRLSDHDLVWIARSPGTPRLRRGIQFAAAAAAVILVVGALVTLVTDPGPDVAGGRPTLEVVFSGTEGDARCVVTGPNRLTEGSIGIVFRNESSTPGFDFMDFARLDEGRTEQEAREFLDTSFTDRPSWSTAVAQFDVVEQGVVARNDEVVVQPGLHVLICGSNVAGSRTLPDFGVFGAAIEVAPAP